MRNKVLWLAQTACRIILLLSQCSQIQTSVKDLIHISPYIEGFLYPSLSHSLQASLAMNSTTLAQVNLSPLNFQVRRFWFRVPWLIKKLELVWQKSDRHWTSLKPFTIYGVPLRFILQKRKRNESLINTCFLYFEIAVCLYIGCVFIILRVISLIQAAYNGSGIWFSLLPSMMHELWSMAPGSILNMVHD